MDLKEELKKKALLVENALEGYLPLPDTYPAVIHQAVRYSVFAGGKRLRPALVMAGAEAVGGDPQKVLPAACALELLHTYSLVHDDLPAMDNDDYRRGKPTSHKVFGEAVAVLAGDALLTLSFQLLAENAAGGSAGPEDVLRVIGEVAVAAGTFGMIGGQVVDIFSAGRAVDADTIKYIHSHKTASICRVAVRAGAILAGAKEAPLAALTDYAGHLGLAFQIKDDLLDFEGEAEKIGKPVGSDLRNKKATYPLVFGVEEARAEAGRAADRALAALECFGSEVEFLRRLAYFVIDRES
ncbi:MAG: polyprenyl synthetase family protein [Peptococcaceae bacterium]|jgi:geranylgeranyl diphosphate synthase type II|nr:MAG: polyprenyl synthetase family protein [Peptococcaceae bacterium]